MALVRPLLIFLRRCRTFVRTAAPRATVGLVVAYLATPPTLAESTLATLGRPLIEQVGSGQNVVDGPVWSVARTAQGDLIVGSNRLSVRTDQRWETIPLPEAHAFRALAPSPDGSRIWVGALHQLGYLDRDAAGEWSFHSLVDAWRRDTQTSPNDVWVAEPLATGALWLTTDRVARWDGQKFQTWRARGSLRLIGSGADGQLWYYDDGHGLLRLGATGDPELVVAESALPQPPVTWMLAPSNPDDHLILGLADGIYRWSASTGLTPLPELTQTLQNTLPVNAVRFADGDLAVATFRAGVIITDAEGRLRETINREHGLTDNTIYSLTAYDDHLWVGFHGGLARVDGVGKAFIIDRQSGLGDGMPRQVQFTGDTAWLLTSKELFSHLPNRDGIHSVLPSQTLLWSALPQANGVWIGGFGGLWRADNRSARREHFTTTDVISLAATGRYPSGVMFVEGYRLKSLRPSAHGGWVPQDLDVTLRDTPISLFEASSGDVWVGTMSSGVDRYRWKTDPTAPPQLQLAVHYIPGEQLPAGANRTQVFELADQIFAFTDAGILRLDGDRRRFLLDPACHDFIGIASAPTADPSVGYWLVIPRELAATGSSVILRVSLRSSQLTLEPVHSHGLDRVGNPVALNHGADALWLSGTEGILALDDKSLVATESPPIVQTRLRAEDADGQAIAIDLAANPQLPARTRRLDFRTRPAVTDYDRVYLQSRLVGAESNWSDPTQNTQQSFSGLAAGRYRFEVRSVDPFGRVGPISHLGFTVMAPWYVRGPTIFAYVVLFLGLVGAISRWQIHRLRRKNEYLNLLVDKRTRELALSNTAKSDFLENISHEIRNPLNGLNGLLGLLKEENLGPRERELTRSLRAVSNKLMSVFEDVLSFSRLEYGYVTVDTQPFRLRPLLEEIVDLFAVQFRNKDRDVTFEWPDDLIDGFRGDHQKIRTVIENLVGNALKYAPGSPVYIRVVHDPETSATSPVDLQIEVADEGPGIPLEEQVLIFSKFARGSRATREQISGTGLGLATCRALAQLMGGEVMLNSEVGLGSEFALVLALARADVPEVAPVAPAPIFAGLGTNHPFGSINALVVEDEPYNQMVLEGLALELGYAVDVASTAEEAMERVSTTYYAIIFLDWELPKAKGVEVAHVVRAQSGGDQPIILATTAHDSEVIRERCRQAGMDAFLLKPYDTDTVRQLIGNVQAKRAGARTVVAAGTTAHPTSAPEPFNRQAFSHYSRVRGEQESTAIQHFVSTLDLEYAEIEKQLALQELSLAKFHAHRLRALAGLIGAKDLNLAAKRLEDVLAHPVNETEWTPAWDRCQSALGTLKARLQILAD